MAIEGPDRQQLREVAESLDMTLSDRDLDAYLGLMQPSIDAYRVVDGLPDNVPDVAYPRDGGYEPDPRDNPLNAWYVKTDIRGAAHGPLSGVRVAIKDNVCVAGVPMMNGTSILEGFVPTIDATVVTRLLDAGATITGKAHCEAYCFSGGSHTGSKGPVRNPWRDGYSAGGSSSGSAALLAAGEVDMAIGGDQGGSIRMPAAHCGVVGMKPTWGLVPYTGIMTVESTIDHAGPMTRTVEDNARMLDVLAGPDGLDPRQSAPPWPSAVRSDAFTAALGQGVTGLRIGVVEEGFGAEGGDADVDDKVRAGAMRLADLGALVEGVSIPMHALGLTLSCPIVAEGATAQMMKGNGHGGNAKQLYDLALMEAQSAWRTRTDELPDTLRLTMLVGEWFIRQGGGRHYGKAQNLVRRLRDAYDEALQCHDVLLMPTVPIKATPLPPPDASRELYLRRAFETERNTVPTDLTGHPALQLPCGLGDGLPIGMMLIGRHFDEAMLYRVGDAFERSGDWENF